MTSSKKTPKKVKGKSTVARKRGHHVPVRTIERSNLDVLQALQREESEAEAPRRSKSAQVPSQPQRPNQGFQTMEARLPEVLKHYKAADRVHRRPMGSLAQTVVKAKTQEPIARRHSNIRFGRYDQYLYCDIQSGASLEPESIATLQRHLAENIAAGKRVLVALPHDLVLKKKSRELFLNFFKRQTDDHYLLIAKEGLHWSNTWQTIIRHNLAVSEENKALRWVKGKYPAAKVSCSMITDVAYLHCAGALHQEPTMLQEPLQQALQSVELKGELSLPLTMAENDQIKTWSFLHHAVVIDLSRVLCLKQELLEVLQTTLQQHDLTPVAEGIYFATASLFQSWQLQQILKVPRLREVGNIIRTLPLKGSYDSIIKIEAKDIAKVCMRQDPPVVLMIHQVQGPRKTIQAMQRFSPEFILCDEMLHARKIKERLPKKQKKHVLHMTPATDPGLMILGPNMITQGYDMKLFADYILAQYHNSRGRPNETFIYYFDTNPENFGKILTMVKMEFAHALLADQAKVLDALAQCETLPDKQGHFEITLLEDQIINFDASLSFTAPGAVKLLRCYPEIFPHHNAELCNSLRLFTQKEPSAKIAAVKLHLIDDYNEITIKQDSFQIEARLQKQQSIMTIKSMPDENLQRRCFTIFALLSASRIFNHLPNKELLVDLITLLWETYEQADMPQQGFLITLISSAQKSKLQIFQHQNNRALLQEDLQGACPSLHFTGQIISRSQTIERLANSIRLFFLAHEEEGRDEKNWCYACQEALKAVTRTSSSTCALCFDFRIQGEQWSTLFVVNPQGKITQQMERLRRDSLNFEETSLMAPSAMERIRQGVDQVKISEESQQILLLRGSQIDTAGEEVEQLEDDLMVIELDQVDESAMLQEVAEAKAEEEAARSARLQDVYAQALARLQSKTAIEDDETEEPGGPQDQSSPAADLTAIPKRQQAYQRLPSGPLDQQFKQLKKRMGISILIFLAFSLGLIKWYMYRIPKPKQRQDPKQIIPVATARQSSRPQVIIKRRQVDPAKEFIRTLLRQLRIAKEPEQIKLNAILKYIYFNAKPYKKAPSVGDIYNITARLYYYKVYLDAGPQLFSQAQKRVWRREAARLFTKAYKAYKAPGAQTHFIVLVMPWMPESKLQGKGGHKVIKYRNTAQAAADMQKWSRMVRQGF